MFYMRCKSNVKISMTVMVIALLSCGWSEGTGSGSLRNWWKTRDRHDSEDADSKRDASAREEVPEKRRGQGLLGILSHVNEMKFQKQFEQAKRIMERGVPDREAMDEVLKLATPAAENGNADAQAFLGDCYSGLSDLKQGVESAKWLVVAAHWYLKAAELGNRYAQGRIATFYLEGQGVPGNAAEAYKWARKAGIPIKNANIQLEDGRSGIVLVPEELPPSQLTIDVEYDVAYPESYKIFGEHVTVREIQRQVKERYLRYGDFPCMIRADKRVSYRHVSKVIAACMAGQVEARRTDENVPAESRISFVALCDARSDTCSTLNVGILKPPPPPLTLDVEKSGDVSMSDEAVTDAMIIDAIKRRVAIYGTDFPCVIRAYEDTPYKYVKRVMALCGVAGMWKTSFVAVGTNGLKGKVAKKSYGVGDGSSESEDLDTVIEIDVGSCGVGYNGCDVSFNQLVDLIKLMAEVSPDASVIVRCTPDSLHGSLMKVLDICNKYKMHNLSITDNSLTPDEEDRAIATIEREEDDFDERSLPPDMEDEPDILLSLEEDRSLPQGLQDLSCGTSVDILELVPPSVEPHGIKPAPIDAILKMKSTVTLKNVAGTARNAGVRGKYLTGGGMYGDANTERAVMMALRWLKETQIKDNEKSPDYGAWGAKPELGLTRGMDKAAGAGFAVLTFLAHGETPSSKEFGPTVERAINYLINNTYVVKGKDGHEAKDPNGNTPYVKMRGAGGAEYGFLIGTYALCEAYAMTKNPNARAAAELALGRIISGQTPTGGWNYNMKRSPSEGQPDDISFGGWALQALKAGKMAGIHLPGMEECIKKAVKCLKTRNYSEKAGFVYRATNNHKGGSGGLGGVGCLAMQLLGYAKEPEVANALRVMTNWGPTFDKKHMSGGGSSQYYSYYAAQCKYQAGMAKGAPPAYLTNWKKWNAEMKALYPRAITTVMDPKTDKPYTIEDAKGNPRQIGYWKSNDSFGMDNYYVMSTCLVALQLMVYYRYLPTAQLKATEIELDVESLTKETSGAIDIEVDI